MNLRTPAPVVALLLVTACSERDGASGGSGLPDLAALATEWSGGQTRPRCEAMATQDARPGTMERQSCVWDTPPGAVARGAVSGWADAEGRPYFVHWDRPTDGATDADRLVDSLGARLAAGGLVARPCGDGRGPTEQVASTLWESPTTIVHVRRTTPVDEAPRLDVLVFGGAVPLPMILCPGEEPA